MDQAWFAVGVPPVVAVVTAVYATGGRNALARRAIRQDLEIAALLPDGEARSALLRAADEKAVLYVSRWVGPQLLSLRAHAWFGLLVATGVCLTWGASIAGNAVDEFAWLALAVLGLVVGMCLTALGLTMWVSLIALADNARTRSSTVKIRQDRLRNYLNVDAGE